MIVLTSVLVYFLTVHQIAIITLITVRKIPTRIIVMAGIMHTIAIEGTIQM